jgi:hypothetical protein
MQEGWVRFPYGLLRVAGNKGVWNVPQRFDAFVRQTPKLAKWWNKQTRGAQNAVPSKAWECNSPLGHSIAGLAGA